MYGTIRRWFIGDYLSEQHNIHNRARAELLFDASMLVFLICIPLTIYTVVAGLHGKTVPTLIGLLFVFVQLLLFKRYQNVWLSSFMLCMLTSVIVCININFNETTIHLVEPFWMIVIVVFAVFMMGVKWGVFFCMILMTGFTFFVVNSLQENLRTVLNSIPSIKYFLVIEIAAALFTLIYILSVFVSTTRKSEQALREGNEHLEVQNQLVNRQNTEITLLLKEIHHRVKNNLQVVNSLLRLQSDQIQDESSRNVFDDAQYRIKAIALIHERMYKSADLSDVSPSDYFRGLASDLLRQYSTGHIVELSVKVDLDEWNQDKVVPMGLLLNELIANSIEHGKLDFNGRITIHLVKTDDGCELIYSDNGCGFASDYQTGFGLELIDTLCAQLNGHMEQTGEPGKGVHYYFAFRD